MHDAIPKTRLTRQARAQLLAAAAALIGGILITGCGGSSGSPPVAAVSSTSTSRSTASSAGGATTSGSSAATGNAAASSGPTTPAALESQALAYSTCMRTNGVPNFPDPTPGGGFLFQRGTGVDPSSTSFKAAQAKCQKLLPAGPLGPRAQTHPSAQALTHWVSVAQCMRRHGIAKFPDPTTAVPHPLPGGGVISDREGVILVFPHTIDEQSPQFARAAAACGFQLTNH